MSTYEDDHNITTQINHNGHGGVSGNGSNDRDPDRSRTHQTLSSVIDSFLNSSGNSNSNANHDPSHVEAFTSALRLLSNEDGSSLASDLMESLQHQIESEGGLAGVGATQKGISDEYLDSLDRVNIKDLDKDADCPICTNKFVDDKYPLIVKLPCTGVSNSLKPSSKSRGHIFDLDCIGPWLKMNSTCPLCRFDLLELNKKRKEKLDQELKQIREQQQEEEEEEEWDDYA